MGPRIRLLCTLALAAIAVGGFVAGVHILDHHSLHMKLALFLNDNSAIESLKGEHRQGLAVLAASASAAAILFARFLRWAIREIREVCADQPPLPFN